MTLRLRRCVGVVLSAAALGALGAIVTPAVSSACVPGETGVTNGCAPFCLPGKYLDMSTGLCTPAPPGSPPGVLPPAGVIPPYRP